MRNEELAPNEAMSRGLTEYGVLDMGVGISLLLATNEHSVKWDATRPAATNVLLVATAVKAGEARPIRILP